MSKLNSSLERHKVSQVGELVDGQLYIHFGLWASEPGKGCKTPEHVTEGFLHG